jgi:N-acetylglutamate synthase-like GNAT family acetyltransferase
MTMTNTKIEFIIINRCNRELFEATVAKANEVWLEAFGNKYNYGQCPSDEVVIGYIDDDDNTPVCCAIVQYKHPVALISCIASNPTNNGYGTLLMEYIKNHFKNIKIDKINLNIDIDDNSDRLIKFYSKFGFVKEDSDNEDHSVFEYDTSIEFRMTSDLE